MRVLLVDVNNRRKIVETDNPNPYEVARKLLGDWAEKVNTRIASDGSIVMMVDDTGLLKGLPVNGIASYNWYPGTICGNVVLCKTDIVYDEDGPTIFIEDYDWKAAGLY